MATEIVETLEVSHVHTSHVVMTMETTVEQQGGKTDFIIISLKEEEEEYIKVVSEVKSIEDVSSIEEEKLEETLVPLVQQEEEEQETDVIAVSFKEEEIDGYIKAIIEVKSIEDVPSQHKELLEGEQKNEETHVEQAEQSVIVLGEPKNSDEKNHCNTNSPEQQGTISENQKEIVEAQECVEISLEERYKILFSSCTNGDAELLFKTISPSPSELKESQENGETILTAKPWEPDDKSDMMSQQITVRKGVDINWKNPEQAHNTALHQATAQSHMNCVLLLLRCKGCDPNIQNDDGHTPLHIACMKEHVQCAHVLLQKGAKLDIKDKNGDTPVHMSIKLAKDGCSKIFVEFGADISLHYDPDLASKRKESMIKENRWEDDSNIHYDSYGFPIVEGVKKPKIQDALKKINGKERIKKWKKMIKTSEFNKTSKKLKNRIRKGIPDIFRGEVYKLLLPIKSLKQKNPKLYHDCKYNKTADPRHCKQIDLDINRTYREHRHFRERYGPTQIKLYNILRAYSIHNPKVGYCQGMSNVTAMFLIFLDDEEDVFWALAYLLSSDKYSMEEIFVSGFPRLMECFYIHERILKKKFPSLLNHFNNEGVMTSLYATRWYMLNLLDCVPFEIAIRIWDIFLSEGCKTTYNFAYTLIKLLDEKKLMKMSLEKLMKLFKDLEFMDFDLDKFLKMATTEKIKKKKLLKYAEEFRLQKK